MNNLPATLARRTSPDFDIHREFMMVFEQIVRGKLITRAAFVRVMPRESSPRTLVKQHQNIRGSWWPVTLPAHYRFLWKQHYGGKVFAPRGHLSSNWRGSVENRGAPERLSRLLETSGSEVPLLCNQTDEVTHVHDANLPDFIAQFPQKRNILCMLLALRGKHEQALAQDRNLCSEQFHLYASAFTTLLLLLFSFRSF